MNNTELWQTVLSQMQFHISKANFATWFQNTEIISKENEKIIISVPNAFSKEWLSNKYNKLILKILHNTDESIKDIEFIIKPQPIKNSLTKSSLEVKKIEESQLKFEEFKIDKNTNLNPRYTFDNFVVGSFNELAHAAALAVADNPGFNYNPLFIYGGTGLGKTHLMQAIGNKIAEGDLKNKKVKYISSEKLVAGIVSAIRTNTMENFKASLAPIDVLILDDIQFIAGKTKSQEEFFHVFNSLYEKNKQIILSSDRPPNAIPELEDRLKSRFEGGMIADVSLPDYETRLVILKTKLQEKEADLPEEVLNYVAINVKKNIRELEGALNKILVCQKLNQPLSIESVKKMLSGFISSPFDVANYKKIIETVAKFYNLEEKNLFDPTRRKEIVRPRQVAMFLLRRELKYSFPAIARKFGGKDHTTAIYAYKKIDKENEENNKLTEELNLIKQRIYSG
jgi:chromosomal replication initiator protein